MHLDTDVSGTETEKKEFCPIISLKLKTSAALELIIRGQELLYSCYPFKILVTDLQKYKQKCIM